MALTGTMARIGGFIAPFIAGISLTKDILFPSYGLGLGVKDSSIPFLIFGGAAIIGGVASSLLPETRGVKLPETVEDVERIVLNRCKGCCKRK